MTGRRVRPAALAALVPALLAACGTPDPRPPAEGPRPMRLAVLGNSDSHAYQDSVSFPPGLEMRGGARRATTLQWTEVLQRLRGTAIDQGAWGVRGRTGPQVRIASWFGVHVRSPRKMDFAYNVAYSGARCGALGGPFGQLAQLERTLAEEPAAWEGGVVLVRIGINDLGVRESLDAVARDGFTDAHRARVRECTDTILGAVRALRAGHPRLRAVLVGIADNANWPRNHAAFRSAEAMRSLTAMHDAYDGALRAFAAADSGVAFVDDRAFLAARWGGRGPGGEPAYRPFEVAGRTVTLSDGDDPSNAFVADGHAGTVFNTLWAQALVQVMNERLGAGIPPITDAEVAEFLRATLGP